MLWIVVLIGAAILVLSLSDNGGFTRIDTSKALDLVNTGKVDSAKLINNERMELTLKQGESFSDGDKVKNATKVYAYYVTARGTNVVAALDAHVPPNGYTDQIDETNWFGSMLVSLIPIIIVLGLFWFLMGQMQGGGSRVMQFGKSTRQAASQGHAEGHLRRRRRVRRGGRGALRDQGVPPGPGQVPGGRRQDPQGRAALRPARHR